MRIFSNTGLIQTLLLLILLITEFLEFYTAVLLLRLNIGIGEILALHSAVYEKADMERIPPDTAAYKVVEEGLLIIRRPEKRARIK